jgi:D-alanine-D-alanine ligase
MQKLRVGILYGGKSVEHAVSINSAKNIFEQIDRTRFEPIAFGIDQTGEWFNTASVGRNISKGAPVEFIMNPNNPRIIFAGIHMKLDVVFPLLHGTDGEDGSIQGFFHAMNIPCVGSGVLGSALSMNKIVAKQLMQQAGLPIGKFVWFKKTERSKIGYQNIVDQLGLPFMTKAASLGSSVGVSKVKSEKDFVRSIDEAFKYDDEILFEEYISGREIECAVLGNSPTIASLPGEIVINGQYEFYTFDAKYVDPNAVRIDVPAKLDASKAEEIRSLSMQAFHTLRCLDYARVDLFLSDKNKVFINEINTIPGFTNSSMFPMMWKQQGISFGDLITKLIDATMERHKSTLGVSRDFQSSLKY